MKKCQPTAKIRKQLNKVIKNAHKLCFSCIKTYEHIGTIFDYSGNKLIYDLIKQHLFRFIYKDNANSFPIIQLKYMDSKQVIPVTNRFQIDRTKLNFSKITFTRCVKTLIMHIHRSIQPVNCSSNYDFKPYETIVQIP